MNAVGDLRAVLISLGVAALLLLLAGLFTTIEAALATISRARLEEMDDKRSTRILLTVTENRARFINPLVLVRTVCEAFAAALITFAAVDVVDSTWVLVVAVMVITLATFILVGAVSSTLGRRNPYTVAARAAIVLTALRKVMGPLSTLLIRMGMWIYPGRSREDGPLSGEVELREMVDMAQQRGVVQVEERRMIQAVFDLAQTRARQVMVPRTDMLWIEADKTVDQAISLCVKSGHSRIPVVGDSVDDIRGITYLKDLIAFVHRPGVVDASASAPGRQRVDSVMRPAQFVPDSVLLDDLLDHMQSSHDHIAMLVDEWGGIAGLISIEDILEEIVGEISDEYDADEVQPVVELEDGRFRVVARFSLDELEELFQEERGVDVEFTPEQREEVDTVGGLMAFELGRVPLPGAEVSTAGLHLICEGGRDRRGRLRINSVVAEWVGNGATDGVDETKAGKAS